MMLFPVRFFSLIHELYTNIAVHGSPGGEYRLIVFWDDDDLIHVDQVNDISSKNLFPDKPVSGNGLSLHMKWIKSIGGFAKTSSEKGAWQFHARFSCHHVRRLGRASVGLAGTWGISLQNTY